MENSIIQRSIVITRFGVSIRNISTERNLLLDNEGNLVEYDKLVIATSLQMSREIAIAEALKKSCLQRNTIWTESVAVGTEQYLEQVKEKLKIRQPGRRLKEVGGETCLREPTFQLYSIFEA